MSEYLSFVSIRFESDHLQQQQSKTLPQKNIAGDWREILPKISSFPSEGSLSLCLRLGSAPHRAWLFALATRSSELCLEGVATQALWADAKTTCKADLGWYGDGCTGCCLWYRVRKDMIQDERCIIFLTCFFLCFCWRVCKAPHAPVSWFLWRLAPGSVGLWHGLVVVRMLSLKPLKFVYAKFWISCNTRTQTWPCLETQKGSNGQSASVPMTSQNRTNGKNDW